MVQSAITIVFYGVGVYEFLKNLCLKKMKITQNTIFITGGTSGIGLEMVKQFYELNNRIIVSSSNQSNLEKLKIQFPKISTVVCDLKNGKSVEQLIDHCLAVHSEINVVINNAGIQHNY